MVREITGIRVEHKSPHAKVKPKVSVDIDSQVDPKSPAGKNVVKDGEIDTSPEKQDVLSESTNFDAEKPELKSGKTDDQKVNYSSIKHSSETTAVGNTRKTSTSQKTSDVTVDKQVCERPLAIETPAIPTPSNLKSPSSCRKAQPSTPFGTKNYIDEDSCSIASSAASGQTTLSRVTTGVAPTFASDERIQKRKEYYAKLEEKRKALEAERQEYEARTKEEEEASIKQLRKTMVYRANPVPSFYYDKPPPKKQLKKLPTTRPISPKFGRRKSFSDAVSHSTEEKVYGRAQSSRYSLGSQSKCSAPTSSSRKTEKDRPKAAKETIKRSPNVNIAVRS